MRFPWLTLPLALAACATTPEFVPARLLSGADLIYPPEMLRQGKQAMVDLSCEIEPDGRVQHCKVTGNDGEPAFGPAAINHIAQLRYAPATLAGAPVASARDFVVSYQLAAPQIVVEASPVGQWWPPYPAEERAIGAEGRVDIKCDIGPDGANRNCATMRLQGRKGFEDAALAYLKVLPHRPATIDGTAVAEIKHHYIFIFVMQYGPLEHFADVPDPDGQSAGGIDLSDNDRAITVDCILQIDGSTTGCKLRNRAPGSKTLPLRPELRERALVTAGAAHFSPLVLDGELTVQPNFPIHLIFPPDPS